MHPLYQAARSWLGTRFRHQGRVKKSATSRGGVDCLGLVMGAARECGYDIADLDETNYSKIPDGDYLLRRLCENLDVVFLVASDKWQEASKCEVRSTRCEEINTSNLELRTPNLIKSGDILLFKLDGNPQHLAIADVPGGGKITMIHSYLAAGKVVENHLEEPWISQLVGGFRVNVPYRF